MKPGFASKT